ncbi:MAG: winged helix-turn-helix transcriptional regulator [Clostridia bacterium]|nr:winged helix-turn-helix transcriptional regulator [Clostridia bacterium]
MSKCSVKVLCKNEYLARMIVLIANGLEFEAGMSDIPNGDINIIDSSFHIKGECDYSRTVYICENGENIPKGAFTILSKPFLHKELRETLLSVYSRLYANAGERIVIEKDKLIYKGLFVQLTEKETELFTYLYDRADIPVTRSELMENVWHGEASADANVTDVYVNYIRKKTREVFGVDAIRSVRGVGYMYTEKYTVSDK